MFIKLLISIFFLVFNLHSTDMKMEKQEIENLIKEYILKNPEIIIESLEKFTVSQKE